MMIRKLLCEACGKPKPMHVEDAANGWKQRYKKIAAKKPEVHHITINGEAQPEMATLLCDNCGVKIADGATAVAWTMWKGYEPENWEHEYEQRLF